MIRLIDGVPIAARRTVAGAVSGQTRAAVAAAVVTATCATLRDDRSPGTA
jgi:hypothetical protein